jgi:hypothetical protein
MAQSGQQLGVGVDDQGAARILSGVRGFGDKQSQRDQESNPLRAFHLRSSSFLVSAFG